jgi:predicted nucleic acid-binding protein
LQEIYFLWRPMLKDPDDDMVLELAVASRSQVIVTHNVGDFFRSNSIGIVVERPAAFLKRVRGQT